MSFQQLEPLLPCCFVCVIISVRGAKSMARKTEELCFCCECVFVCVLSTEEEGDCINLFAA